MDGHRAPLAYHARLVADPHRVEAYDRAIRRLVRPGDVVLDLGTGTGLLAMLAARRGARVHAVESTPVIGLAEELASRNGVRDRITFHGADARKLAPVEPVDWIVSDFLGCFLVDDNMLPAVEAAGRWLKPGGRFIPSRVRLYVAPVVDVFLGDLIFDEPQLGLDLAAARPYATGSSERVSLPETALCAPPVLFHDFAPPGPPSTFEAGLSFRVERGGLLAGFAGWFVADLADDVTLANAPGIETHWHQILFRIPERPVEEGDEILMHLHQLDLATDWTWRWAGTVSGRSGVTRFDVVDETWLGECQIVGRAVENAAPAPETAESLYERANAAYLDDRLDDAIALYRSATRALTPDLDALAIDVYENLGIALWRRERWMAAARAFLRALDGGTSREQSLRLIVGCFFRGGRPLDGERWLRRYEAVHGPHPEGWSR